MDARRLRLDPFAFALGALALLTAGFLAARNGAAVVMCALTFAGLLAARLVGFSNRALVPLAAGLVLILWWVWIDPPMDTQQTSALAHGAGGVLVGWALAEYLRCGLPWPVWALAALAGVFGLTVLWELGEYLGDRALDTALIPSRRDSALDIFFGTLGGAAAIGLAGLLRPRRARS
jgi:hypothetical protein